MQITNTSDGGKMVLRIVLGFFLFIVHVTPASAALVCKIIPLGSLDIGIVAKPGKLSEVLSLIKAGETMAAAPVIACAPAVGDKVIITDHGFSSHTVRVLDGKFAGCSGDIVVESVGECK
jgi:hypothetical protein